jgi:alpha-L-fucosidase
MSLQSTNSGPGGAAIKTRLHIFSLSMLPTIGSAIDPEIQFARTTQLWLPGTNKTHIVEVIINNVGSGWVLANDSVKVEISSPALNTVSPGYINRLQPGNQVKVQIGVVNANGVLPGKTGNATVIVSGIGLTPATHSMPPLEPYPMRLPTNLSILTRLHLGTMGRNMGYQSTG